MYRYDKATFILLQTAVAREQEIQISSSGDSMFPLIQEGNTCLFSKVSPTEVKRGDILLFAASDGVLIGHRFHFKDHSGLYHCKGDSNLSFDQPVSFDQVIGKLTGIHKKRYRLQIDGWICKCWGSLLLLFPVLSRLLRKYLRYKASSSN